MKSQKKHLSDLHFEHQLWQSEAKFFADELKIYQNRLDEIASKNTGDEISKKISHFQNQFIIQKEQLDILNHEVKIHEQSLAKFAQENPVAIEHRLFEDHSIMQDKLQTFKKIYSDLKLEFTQFVADSL
ncbi:hypothetical protein AD998_03915 [bacterium 336/3]|nr:hypothetical protein AD998_03915 [bacterium 336/3]